MSETRKIQIANTKTQRRYTIETAATTLGELQDEMTAQGIDFTGMTFTEGISKTQLLNRESLLPTNVMYKGQPTNNLVMLLTNTTKNIASGCDERSRKEAYAIIKDLGKEFSDAIKEEYGKNYTQVTTNNLWAFIDENTEEEYLDGMKEDWEDEQEKENTPDTDDTKQEEPEIPNVKAAPHPDLVELVYLGIKYLTKKGTLYTFDVAVIADLTTELYKRLDEEQPKVSDSDIDDMIASI